MLNHDTGVPAPELAAKASEGIIENPPDAGPVTPSTVGTVSTFESSPPSVGGTSTGAASGIFDPPGAAANPTKRKVPPNPDSPSTPASSKKGKSKSSGSKKTALGDIDFDDSNTVLGEAFKALKPNQQVPASEIDRTKSVVANYPVKELKTFWLKFSNAQPPSRKGPLVDALVALIHRRRAGMKSSEPHSFGVEKNGELVAEMMKKDITEYQKFYADSQNDQSGKCLVGIHPGGGVSVWDNSNAIVRSNRIQEPSSLSLVGWHLCNNISESEVYVEKLLSSKEVRSEVQHIDGKPEATDHQSPEKDQNQNEALAAGFTPPEEYNLKKLMEKMAQRDQADAKKFILDQLKFKEGVYMLVTFADSTTRLLHSLDKSHVFNVNKDGYSGWVTGDRNILERLSSHLAEAHDPNKAKEKRIIDQMDPVNESDANDFVVDHLMQGDGIFLTMLGACGEVVYADSRYEEHYAKHFSPFNPSAWKGMKRFDCPEEAQTFAAQLASDGVVGNLSGRVGAPYSMGSAEAQLRLTHMRVNGKSPIATGDVAERAHASNLGGASTSLTGVMPHATGGGSFGSVAGIGAFQGKTVGLESGNAIQSSMTQASDQGAQGQGNHPGISSNNGFSTPPTRTSAASLEFAAPSDLSSVAIELDVDAIVPAFGVEWEISHGFEHKNGKSTLHIVFMKGMKGANIWHLEGSYFQMVFAGFTQTFTSKGWPVPYFFNTFRDIPIRDPRCKEGKYKRKGVYTVNKLCFVMEVPKSGFSVDDYWNRTRSQIHSIFKESNKTAPGLLYVNWLQANKTPAYEYETGQSGKKKRCTKDELVTTMNKKLILTFGADVKPEWGMPLDKYLTDYHIKEFLQNHCGYTSWGDVANSLKKGVYHKYNGPWPAWDDIEREEY